MDKNREWKQYLVIIGLSLCILLPLLLIAVYNRPCADDYDYAILTHEAVVKGEGLGGLIKAAVKTDINYYKRWQGLYTSAFLLSLQPGIFGEEYYAFSTLIILVLSLLFLWGGIHLIIKRFARENIGEGLLCSFSWSLWIMAVACTMLPSATQGLYWFNGAMNYLPWAFADILCVALIYESTCAEGRRQIVLVLLSMVLAFVISGANHVTAFENILFLSAISVFLLLRRRKWTPFFALLSAVAGFLIVLSAPGTAARQAWFVQPTVVKTMIESFKYTLECVKQWMNLPWLLILISLTPVIIKVIGKNKDAFHHFPLLQIILSFGVLCAMNCVPYYAMGMFGGGRLTNVVWIAFLVLSVVDFACLMGYLIQADVINERGIDVWISRRSVVLLAMCAGLIFISSSSNSLRAVKEIGDGTAQRYAQEMDARIELYHDDSLENVKVRPIQNNSTMVFPGDLLTDNPDVWPNETIGAYYHKKISISTE